MKVKTMAEENTETAEVSTEETSEATENPSTIMGEGNDQQSEDEDSQESSDGDTANKDESSKDSDEASDGEEGDEDENDDGQAVEYEDFKVPEGMEVNEDNMTAFKDLAKGLNDGKGLSQEDAQKLVDLQTKNNEEVFKAQTEQWETIYSEWRGEISSDKELGGKNQPEAMRTAMKAAEHYGDPELVNVLNTNPQYGSNPSLVRFLYRVGKTLTEDQVKSGGRATTKTKSADEILYPQKES